MKTKASKRADVRKRSIKLHNTVHWNRQVGDKVYLQSVYLAIVPWPFDMRKVILRFAEGPGLDFCHLDMDRLTLEYLKLRGVKPPSKLCRLAKAEPPPAADFVVPGHLMTSFPKPTKRQ